MTEWRSIDPGHGRSFVLDAAACGRAEPGVKLGDDGAKLSSTGRITLFCKLIHHRKVPMNRREPGAAGQDHRADAGADAKTPAALCDLGHRHLKAGRILDAQLCCEQALAVDAKCAEAMHLMGLLSLQADQADHAIEWFARAIRHDERSAYLLSLGTTLKR